VNGSVVRPKRAQGRHNTAPFVSGTNVLELYGLLVLLVCELPDGELPLVLPEERVDEVPLF